MSLGTIEILAELHSPRTFRVVVIRVISHSAKVVAQNSILIAKHCFVAGALSRAVLLSRTVAKADPRTI